MLSNVMFVSRFCSCVGLFCICVCLFVIKAYVTFCVNVFCVLVCVGVFGVRFLPIRTFVGPVGESFWIASKRFPSVFEVLTDFLRRLS